MSYYSPSIEKLIESFERLPSIGHKTAVRLAFHILNAGEEEIKEFIDSITNAKANLKYCSKCFNITDTDPCPICASPKREQNTICVVEDVKDVIAMERTHEFKGVYHVLHGSISPMNRNRTRRNKNKRTTHKNSAKPRHKRNNSSYKS